MFLTTSVNYNKYLWICYAQIPYAYVQMRNTTKIPKKWKLHANSENAIKSI